MKFDSIYQRLVVNTHEPEHATACWHWARRRDKWWYGRVTFYVPGLRLNHTVQAHVALWLVLHHGDHVKTADDLYLATLELRAAVLEIDHLCHVPSCINPDHLDEEPVTKKENARRRRSVVR